MFALKRTQFRFCFRMRGALCLEESLLSSQQSFDGVLGERVLLSTQDVWMFGLRTTVKKVRNSSYMVFHMVAELILLQSFWGVPLPTTRVFETWFSLN